VCILSDTEARYCNNCFSGKVMLHILNVCVCVCVDVGIQNSKGLRHTVICSLFGCTVLHHILTIGKIFEIKIY
jgi:hypothetical protein